MKVKVLKEYVGRNSGLLHKAGAIDEWGEIGKYGKALIEHGFVEVIEGHARWKPKIGEDYWYVESNLCVDHFEWENDPIDNRQFNARNCYKTEEEAQKSAKWLEAVGILREDSDSSTKNGTVIAPCSVWYNVGGLVVDSFAVAFTGKTARNNPFPFSSMKDAERSTVDHRQEWLTFFGVEDA